MGLIRFHLNMARRKECRISDVFYCFMNHSNRYFGAYIIYYAISMIAKAPFLVARNFFKLSGDTVGIAIVLYAASAVLSFIVLVLFPFYLYLVLSRDDLSVFTCLTHAIKLIRGNILRVIYINVSFIGMLVLCVLSLGIGLLWVEPYYEQTFVKSLPRCDRGAADSGLHGVVILHLQQPVHNPCCNAALVHNFKLCAVVSRDECDHIGICSKACACYL